MDMKNKGNGARGRSRTADTAIFSRMLYQLSYPGTGPHPAGGRAKSERYKHERGGLSTQMMLNLVPCRAMPKAFARLPGAA